jgi:NLI interacting factor-like phosphatase
MKKPFSASVDISDPKSAATFSTKAIAGASARVRPRPMVLALDLEATLISSAVSQFPRPLLFEFLERCQELFPRIVMFTTIREERFRHIAKTLVDEGSAPRWFEHLEYVDWSGPTKDLSLIPGCAPEHALLVDDLAGYVHPGQESRWVQVEPFEPPFDSADHGLAQVLEELKERVQRPATPRGP